MHDRVEQDGIAEHLHRLFYDELMLCGCGDPNSAWRLVHDILVLAPFYENQRWRAVEQLCGPAGAHHIVLSVLTNAKLLEHGSTIGGSWITDKGRWLLWAIKKVGGLDNLEGQLEAVGLPHNGKHCTPSCWTPPAHTEVS